MNFWKQLGESRYPGALAPVLENFRPDLSPDPTDCPLGLRGCIFYRFVDFLTLNTLTQLYFKKPIYISDQYFFREVTE